MVSENIIRLEYNHHFKSTSGPRLHSDHIDLCIGVMQITIGKPSEVFCSSLVGGGGPVNKLLRKGGLNRARRIILRNVAERVTFQIDLWSKVSTCIQET
jgi:hypothetical protein